jgi:hypothetical protein
MLEQVTTSVSHMCDTDREAIATNLKSLPSIARTAFETQRRELRTGHDRERELHRVNN